MKKSNIITLVMFFFLIPITLYLGLIINKRSYYIIGVIIIAELLIPLLLTFEKKKPQAKELVIIAVMCSLAIVGRIAIPIPHFKATYGIIMLTGISLGPEVGFMVGVVTAFVSNFFYGQGPYMPWQMLAYGAGGMLAGFAFMSKRISRKPVFLAIFGFLATVFFVGPLLDTAHVFLMMPQVNIEYVTASLISGFPVNISQGICTSITMGLFGKPLFEKLDRIKLKYGMLED